MENKKNTLKKPNNKCASQKKSKTLTTYFTKNKIAIYFTQKFTEEFTKKCTNKTKNNWQFNIITFKHIHAK